MTVECYAPPLLGTTSGRHSYFPHRPKQRFQRDHDEGEADLDYNTQIFTRTGFRGALNKYCTRDLDWEELSRLTHISVQQLVLFIGGERDSTIHFASLEATKALPKLRKVVMLPDCGHWAQQERPAEVNAELLAFLHQEVGR